MPGRAAFRPVPERASATRHVTVTVELPGVLAEVPDVSVVILHVEVVGDLARLSVPSDHVVDHGDLHALDLLGPVRYPHVVPESTIRVDASVVPFAAGLERKPRVVDPAHEVARVKRLRPAGAGSGLDRLRALRCASLGARSGNGRHDQGDPSECKGLPLSD